MITNEGKRICDHETKRGTLWCACRKPATVKVPSKVVSYMEFDYCRAHAPAPSVPRSSSLTRERGSEMKHATVTLRRTISDAVGRARLFNQMALTAGFGSAHYYTSMRRKWMKIARSAQREILENQKERAA